MLLVPSVLLAQYSIVLKNGRVLKSKVKPVFIFGHVLYTDIEGKYFDLKYTDVNIEKTWQINAKVKPKKDKKKEVITTDKLKRLSGKLTIPIAGEVKEEEARKGHLRATIHERLPSLGCFYPQLDSTKA
jgi:hypothetical protein